MIIILKSNYSQKELDNLKLLVEKLGCEPIILKGTFNATINVLGDDTKIDIEQFQQQPGVQEVFRIASPFRLASRAFKKDDTIIKVGNAEFGPGKFVIMGGPCAVESEEQTLSIARAVKKAGAQVLRGGAYKPRTSPYAFQGLAEAGLKILQNAREETGLPVITEALDQRSLDLVYKYTDIIQIGTRNMQNFALLRDVSKLDKPVMLKRGMSSTIDEWLQAAEYILAGGNHQVMLCERGIRSFDSRYTRNVIDLGAIPVIKDLCHLPIVVDPSHGSGRKENVAPMSYASLAVGAHSILVDVHDNVSQALCDGQQALTPPDFEQLVNKCIQIATSLSVDVCGNSAKR
jgi:3-deoxy-7-phosphoheptulonate synthase